MKELILRGRGLVLKVAEKLSWLPGLVARLTVGVTFLVSGWGKVHNLEKVTSFFTDLGIPFPALNAMAASATELVCGALLLVGLLSRFAAVPLIVVMTVAIITAKADDISDVADLLGTVEFSYIAMSIYLAIAGPGALSIDHLLLKKLEAKK